MIYTSIRYLRISSIISGFSAIILSAFLVFFSGCKMNSDESGTVPYSVYGYESNMYWIQFALITAVFFSGYFYRDLVNKALLYTFSSILVLFLLITWNLPGGNPCVHQSEIGQICSLYGSLSIILGTFISVYREAE